MKRESKPSFQKLKNSEIFKMKKIRNNLFYMMTDKELRNHEKFSSCSGVGNAFKEFEELSKIDNYSVVKNSSHNRSNSHNLSSAREAPPSKSFIAPSYVHSKTV